MLSYAAFWSLPFSLSILLTHNDSGFVHHGFLFIFIAILYSFLVQLGGTFYSFQWDSLLLETGWLVSMCYAPWKHLTSTVTAAKDNNDSNTMAISNEVGALPIRFLLFKLMFMSGVVKIQANCPTWNNLTALEYHFATQCLPGPFAWYAHQLHPFLLRLSVAMTFLIEIQGAGLLIFWGGSLRRIGAWMQILLQVMIILSGNYNFFNVLTILLCLPCLEGNLSGTSVASDGIRKRNFSRNYMDVSISLAYFAWSFATMFDIQKVQVGIETQITIVLSWTKSFCEVVIEYCVPAVIALVYIQLGYNFISMRKKRISALFHVAACAACLGISSVPFLNLSPGVGSSTWTMLPTRCFVEPWRVVQPYHFSNGYGLFRQMTGVGSHGLHNERFGWGGLPPSMVERSEIVLEGQLSSGEFRELKFRWKPGNVTKQPRQVAPHQPRLDWQMWFAALGNHQNNPWFVHLVSKLLHGCTPVIDLLDEPMLASGEEQLLTVRSILYMYDFTRINTEMYQNDIVNQDWWIRSPSHEFLPALEVANPSLVAFLSSHRFLDDMCVNDEDKCKFLSKNGSKFHYFCPIIKVFRHKWSLLDYTGRICTLSNIIMFHSYLLRCYTYTVYQFYYQDSRQAKNETQ